MTLPAVSLGFIHAGYMMRMTKASMLEVLGSDYIKMARSKGVREWKIVTKHTFRNALLTVIEHDADLLDEMDVVVPVNHIPEFLGYVYGVGAQEAMLNVFINLIIDLIYGLADPRIRLD